MILNEPQDYALLLSEPSGYEVSTANSPCAFSRPASTRGLAKLYTISRDGALIYVGIAQQPMAARLNFGFKAKGAGGYHGYKWKNLRDSMSLAVWTAIVGDRPADMMEVEIIEAEVVYCCRARSGLWPSHQHEIHFHQSTPQDRDAAERVYAHAVSRRP